MSSPLRIADYLRRPSAVPPSTPIRPPRPTRFPIPVYSAGYMSPDTRIASLSCRDVFGYATPVHPRVAALSGWSRSNKAKETTAPTVPTTPAKTRSDHRPLSSSTVTSTPILPRHSTLPVAPVYTAADISPDTKASAHPRRCRDLFDYDTPAKPRVVDGSASSSNVEVAASAAPRVASPAKSILGSSSSLAIFIREENKKAAQRYQEKAAAREAMLAAASSSLPQPPVVPTTAANSHSSSTTVADLIREETKKSAQRWRDKEAAREAGRAASLSSVPSTSTTTTPPSTPPAPVQRASPAKPTRAPPASVTPARLPSTSSTDKKKTRASKGLFEVTEHFLRVYSSEDEKSSTDDVAAIDMIKLAVEGLLQSGVVDKLDIRHLIAVLQPFADNNNRTDSGNTTRRSTAKPKSILKPTSTGKLRSATRTMHVRFAPQAHVKLYDPGSCPISELVR